MRAETILKTARAAGRLALSESEGKALLAAFGVPVPRRVVVTGPDAMDAARDLRPPLAVKVMSPDILHKSDAGGVALDLADMESLRAAMTAMASQPLIAKARLEGYLVEEMAPPGQEIVVGAVRDARFGPLIMVGLGGIFVEVLKDVAFRLCPIGKGEAHAMLAELKGAAVLRGARGRAGVSEAAIVDLLLKIGGAGGMLDVAGGEIAELDVNPVIVGEGGAVAVDARVILADPARQDARQPAPKPYDDLPPGERFAPLFAPRTIAVVGASAKSATIANTFIRRLGAFGYKGAVYPIHPNAPEIEGFKTYPALARTPEPIDYAYVAVGAPAIPDLLAEAGGRVRFAQVISSGFGETAEGRALETELVAKARIGGVRVIGPNCLGLYSPRGGVTFPDNAPATLGGVGILSQSGGLGTDIIKRGQWRGLAFSGLVTIGNSADVGPADLLEFYLDDPQTRVIGLYLEDVRDGKRFLDIMRSPKATKPVVLLVGGLSSQGRAAAASHTGALAGDDRAWQALQRQTRSALVRTVDEFIDTLLALQFLTLRPSRPTRRVALFGNGGGTSVLAVDAFAALGLDVDPFGPETRGALENLGLPPGTSVANPIDAPVRTMQEKDGQVANEILDIVYRGGRPDAVVMHLNLAAFAGRAGVDPIDNLIAAAVAMQERYRGQAHFAIVLRVDGSPELEERKRRYREHALGVGIPVYDELLNAAQALASVAHLERRFADRA